MSRISSDEDEGRYYHLPQGCWNYISSRFRGGPLVGWWFWGKVTSGWGSGRGKNIKEIAKLVDYKKICDACLLVVSWHSQNHLLLFIYLSQNSSKAVSYIVLRSVSMHVQDYRPLNPPIMFPIMCDFSEGVDLAVWVSLSAFNPTVLTSWRYQNNPLVFLSSAGQFWFSYINALPPTPIHPHFHFLHVPIRTIIWNTGRKVRFDEGKWVLTSSVFLC